MNDQDLLVAQADGMLSEALQQMDYWQGRVLQLRSLLERRKRARDRCPETEGGGERCALSAGHEGSHQVEWQIRTTR